MSNPNTKSSYVLLCEEYKEKHTKYEVAAENIISAKITS